jgi:anaerobic selenocysteine-containing dehydrogenase
VPIAFTPSFCRLCTCNCPVDVGVEAGRIVSISGDRTNPIFGGYTCVKGRAQVDFHYHPARLQRPLRRDAAGAFEVVER